MDRFVLDLKAGEAFVMYLYFVVADSSPSRVPGCRTTPAKMPVFFPLALRTLQPVRPARSTVRVPVRVCGPLPLGPPGRFPLPPCGAALQDILSVAKPIPYADLTVGVHLLLLHSAPDYVAIVCSHS